MSPFAVLLRELRVSHGLRQGDLAEAIGYEQSYVSALEVGMKGPPPDEFMERLVDRLSLNEDWRERLRAAVELSQRKFVIPNESPEIVFRLCNELRLKIDQLRPQQIELIRLVLQLQVANDAVSAVRTRIRRRDLRKTNEGVTM